MEEKWINNLRDKMESHEVPEPLGLWDDIEVTLGETKPSPITHYRKVLLWSTGIVAVAAMLTLIFFLGKGDASLFTDPVNKESQIAQQFIEELDTNQNNIITQQIEDKESLLTTNTPSYSKQEIVKKKVSVYAETYVKDDIKERIEDDVLEERQKVDEKDSEKSQTQFEKESQSENKNFFPKRRPTGQPIDNYNYSRTSNNEGKLIASVYSNNLPNTSGESSGYGELIARSTLPGQMSANVVKEQGPAEDIIFSNLGEETTTKIDHKHPIKAGLSLRYQLSDKFGIESGVTYTYLSSNLTSGTAKNMYETEQSLQYIGIPLNVNYNIWDNIQFDFYVSAGGLAEKNIAGKSHTNYIINNQIEKTEHNKIKESSLQLSVNSSLGLQVNVLPKLGVFVEPGIGYYFNNGSDIKTIYKEKPFNYNLKIGVRVNIR